MGGEVESFDLIADFIPEARAALDDAAFDYIAGGAGDEIGLAENVAAFERRRLIPRVLRGIAEVDLRTTMLGREVTMPLGLAPTGFNRLADPEGEVAVGRAAASTGVISCLSTLSSRTIEDVGAASDRPWFQLYVLKDRGITRSHIERAESAGFTALMITVDLPVVGRRDREIHHGLELPPEMFANFKVPATSGELSEVVVGEIQQSLSWKDIEELSALSSLPVVLKGILSPEDARIAAELEIAGVVVSNHGGRQIDRAIAPIDALSPIVDAAAGRYEVFLDGGVRRGIDVVIALALGARAVFIGRPYLYALAAAGGSGVERCLELFRSEMLTALHLLGAGSIDEIDSSLVV